VAARLRPFLDQGCLPAHRLLRRRQARTHLRPRSSISSLKALQTSRSCSASAALSLQTRSADLGKISGRGCVQFRLRPRPPARRAPARRVHARPRSFGLMHASADGNGRQSAQERSGCELAEKMQAAWKALRTIDKIHRTICLKEMTETSALKDNTETSAAATGEPKRLRPRAVH
jgi:hypothetical protein